MLSLQGVVVADDAAGLRPVLVSSCSAMGQVTQSWEVLLYIQDVGMCIHALCTNIGWAYGRGIVQDMFQDQSQAC